MPKTVRHAPNPVWRSFVHAEPSETQLIFMFDAVSNSRKLDSDFILDASALEGNVSPGLKHLSEFEEMHNESRYCFLLFVVGTSRESSLLFICD